MYTNSELAIPMVANADYSSTGQYLFVTMASGNTKCILVANQGVRCVGVLSDNPASGVVGRVVVGGITKVKSGDTVAAGDLVTTGADARAEVAQSGDFVVGRAMTAGNDGEIISVLLTYEGVL